MPEQLRRRHMTHPPSPPILKSRDPSHLTAMSVSQSSPAIFAQLPTELLINVCAFLDIPSLKAASLASFRFHIASLPVRSRYMAAFAQALQVVGVKHTILLQKHWLSVFLPDDFVAGHNPYPRSLAPFTYFLDFGTNLLFLRALVDNPILRHEIDSLSFVFTPLGIDIENETHRFLLIKEQFELFKQVLGNNRSIRTITIDGFVEDAIPFRPMRLLIDEILTFIVSSHVEKVEFNGHITRDINEIIERLSGVNKVPCWKIMGSVDEAHMPDVEELVLSHLDEYPNIGVITDSRKQHSIRTLKASSSARLALPDATTFKDLEKVTLLLAHIHGNWEGVREMVNHLMIDGSEWSREYPEWLDKDFTSFKSQVFNLELIDIKNSPQSFLDSFDEFLSHGDTLQELSLRFVQDPHIYRTVAKKHLKKLEIRYSEIHHSIFAAEYVKDSLQFLMNDEASVDELVLACEYFDLDAFITLLGPVVKQLEANNNIKSVCIEGIPTCQHVQGSICISCSSRLLDLFKGSEKFKLNKFSTVDLRSNLVSHLTSRGIPSSSNERLVKFIETKEFILDHNGLRYE